jgi:hypothetical protein
MRPGISFTDDYLDPRHSRFKICFVLIFLQKSPIVDYVTGSVDYISWINMKTSFKTCIIPSFSHSPANNCCTAEH